MRLLPSDPDVETIITRIDAGDLNLQPDFQRGEVWSKLKKQRLVDSILRDWHVPPVHVIELSDSRRQEVLDGQQRLVAIRDFARGDFAIDGSIEPVDSRISALDGMKYRELPDDVKRQFHQFTIRVFRIVDYKADEPAELFFRLNQPTNLTSAEQRNAFFGVVRQQIKGLVEAFERYGLDKAFLGFSNSRMAYDDVLSRVALSVERRSIAAKISSSDLVGLYRSNDPISSSTEEVLRWSLNCLAEAKKSGRPHPRFNKATLYSWLVFLVRAATDQNLRSDLDGKSLAALLEFFEATSLHASIGLDEPMSGPAKKLEWLFSAYEDRSTSRVADVSSVVLRDLVIWYVFSHYRATLSNASVESVLPGGLVAVSDLIGTLEADAMAKALLDAGWGELG